MLLLAAVLFLNYVDRGALPTAAHHIQEDLHLTFLQLGMLGSAFFWTYALVQIPMGWLAERYGAHRVLAYGLAIWALATMLVGVVSGFVMLLILRLLLGLGESVGFPCTSKILASSVPNQSLGTANGIIAFAYLLGPVVGTFVGGVLMTEFGWRTAFVVFGAVSQIIAGPAAAGRWVGIQNTIGNLAGIVAPALTGFVIDWTGHFTLAFVLAAAVGVVGFIGWVFMIPQVAELNWQAQAAGRSSIASTRLG